jgi:hypothetical protein
VKRVFVFCLSLPLLFACAKPASGPPEGYISLPDLGITMVIPPGMEAAGPEQLKRLQDSSAEFPPVLPFADFPCYQFFDPDSGAVMVLSRMDFVDPAATAGNPVEIMDEYRKNLEQYYGVDSIAANELVQGDFRLLSMNLLYEPEGRDKSLYLTRVLYHRFPQRYFMIELFLDPENTGPDEAQKYGEMILSVEAADN